MIKLSMMKENKNQEMDDTPAVKLWNELLISGYERGPVIFILSRESIRL